MLYWLSVILLRVQIRVVEGLSFCNLIFLSLSFLSERLLIHVHAMSFNGVKGPGAAGVFKRTQCSRCSLLLCLKRISALFLSNSGLVSCHFDLWHN